RAMSAIPQSRTLGGDRRGTGLHLFFGGLGVLPGGGGQPQMRCSTEGMANRPSTSVVRAGVHTSPGCQCQSKDIGEWVASVKAESRLPSSDQASSKPWAAIEGQRSEHLLLEAKKPVAD